MSPINCTFCGEEYLPVRASQKFCSTPCRVNHSRQYGPRPGQFSRRPHPEAIPIRKEESPGTGTMPRPIRVRRSYPNAFRDSTPPDLDTDQFARRGRLVGIGLGLLALSLLWGKRRRPMDIPFGLLLALLVVAPAYLGYWLGEYFDAKDAKR